MTHRHPLLAAPFRLLTGAGCIAALLAASACSGGGDDARPAAAVSTSTSATVVTGNSTDLGAIVLGLGNNITTPKPEDVHARCTGTGADLSVEIEAPGWHIAATNPSQTLSVAKTDADLTGDIDTTNRYLDTLKAVDWSEENQLDIAATVQAPAQWKQPDPTVYLSIHIDCR